MSRGTPNNSAPRRPRVDLEGAQEAAMGLWGASGDIEELPGDRDRNYRVRAGAESLVLKITDANEGELALSLAALERLSGAGGELTVGRSIPTLAGDPWSEINGADGRGHKVWAVRWVEGVPLAHAGPRAPGLLGQIGEGLGVIRRSLDGWDHPALGRRLKWDLRRGLRVARELEVGLANAQERRIVRESLASIEVALSLKTENLRVGVIHGDASDHNLLVEGTGPATGPCGLIDVGDIDESWVIAEVAICAAYLMLEEPDPLEALVELVRGYHKADPIPPSELGLVFDLARLRLCVSATVAAQQRAHEPDNEYLSVTTGPAIDLLARLQRFDRDVVNQSLAKACGMTLPNDITEHGEQLFERRRKGLGGNFSLSYGSPLEIVRGEGRYLIAAGGRSYLDAVNNVPQVGHSNPRVVARAAEQMAVLNTNTRYLSSVRMGFVERLVSTLPPALEVVYLVNSGSEANELARRLVSAHVGEGDWVVLEGGYHGNTSGLVDLSPYKFNGPGGGGCPPHVRVAQLPDRHRGEWGYDVTDSGVRYARDVTHKIEECEKSERPVVAFIAEAIPGCAGQVVLPDGYLAASYAAIREVGGLAIADEVQVGCGRVGTHWWAFESQDVVPDIVTMGKPLGNGHPIGAVVTTQEVAASFSKGMEYFNTFGGNPVSCAVGDEVLAVINEESLRENAATTGAMLLEGLIDLQLRHEVIGDVRGLGLYLGVVCDRRGEPKAPDAKLADFVVEDMRSRGVLISTDGVDHDVIKIKPPLVFGPSDAEHFLARLSDSFEEAERSLG